MNTNEKKRLKAIKQKYNPLVQCRCCGKRSVSKFIWQVKRYGINNNIYNYYYCQNCMHSAEEVLNEVDTDDSPYGIAFVDEPLITKKDLSRMKEMAFGVDF